MSNTASTISVELAGRDVGLSTLLTQVDAKTQKSADSAARLQAQYARLAASQGNSAQATNILSNALTNNGGASARVVTSLAQQLTVLQKGGSAMTQFASAANGLTGALGQVGTAASGLNGRLGQFSGNLSQIGGAIGGLPGQLLSVGTGIGVVTAAIGIGGGVVKSFAEAFTFKAELDQSTASIKILLNGVRDSGEVFAGAARFAAQYKLTQKETTEAIQSSIPVIRNSKASIEEVLGVFARLKVLKPEKTFADAARSLGELQAGQIVSIVDQFNIARPAANAMKDAIAGGADAVKVLGDYLTSAGVGMDALAVGTQGATGKMKELAQQEEQLKLAQAAFAQGPGMAILNEKIKLTSGLTRILSGDFGAMGQSIKTTIAEQIAAGAAHNAYFQAVSAGNTATQASAAAQAAYNASLQAGAQATTQAATEATAAAAGTAAYNAVIAQGGNIVQANTAYEAAHATSLAQSGAAAVAATTAFGAYSAAAIASAGATAQSAAIAQQSTTAQLGYADSLAMVGVQANAAALAAQQKGTADQVAAVDAQTHALAQQQLATAAQTAAQALLAGGQAGANTAALLAGSSSRVDVLTAAYYRLAAAQAAAKVADPLKGVTEDRSTRDTTADRAKVKSDQALESNRKLLASIAAVEKAANKPPKGGGGGPKLTDQQKLNNSLQADQTSADAKYEDAAKAHLKRLLDIQKDFSAKSLAQQQSNEISKRQSQADFYDRLTSSDLNKKAGGSAALQKIDADYQAAYQKSQEIAQAGNAKLAADYLALKQKQAESELTFQENTAKAAADKDKAEVDRLAKIQALRRAAQAEEEKQLLAGGDTNVNERDKALADEEAKNQESQDKIGTAAERAADRKIAASVANGNAVDAEIARVNALGTAYGKLPPPRGSAATGAGTTPTTPDALPATPGESPTGAIVSALNGAQSAIVSALAAVQSATKEGASKVASAVSSLPRSVT